MRGFTTKEKVKITAGAVASLVIVGWLVVLAIAFSFRTIKRKGPMKARRIFAGYEGAPGPGHTPLVREPG